MSKLSLKTRGQIIVHFDLDLCHNPRGHEGRGSNLCTAPGVVVFGRWGWRRLPHSVVSGRRPHHRQKSPSSGCFIRSVATTCVLAVAGKPENHGTSQGTLGQSLREVVLPIEPGWADEYRSPVVSCSHRPARLPVAARRPRQVRLPHLVNRAEQPDWWLPQTVSTEHAAASVRPHAEQVTSTSGASVKEEPAQDASPDLGYDADWAPASD